MKPIGIGVVGLGLMGRVHIEAYAAANGAGELCRLIAVSDRNRSRFDGRARAGGNVQADIEGQLLFDPSVVATSTDPHDMFANSAVDLVSICTPTDTHVELAIQALRAGKHVIVEKPVSLDLSEILRLADVARETKRLCMPAMCMRFWPGWSWLLEAVRDNRYGAIESAVFQRLGARPTWGDGFYSDPRRSGGALFDLHIHDVDFVAALFGEPTAVTATGSVDHVTTLYRFANGPAEVTAEGGWDPSPDFAFRMRYVVKFERATAAFDSRRDLPLEITPRSTSSPVDRITGTGYDFQIRHVLKSVREGLASTAITLADAELVTRILIAERESLEHRVERSVL